MKKFKFSSASVTAGLLLAATLLPAISSANPYFTDVNKPVKRGNTVVGWAHVTPRCHLTDFYTACNWHTTIERSSWRGYQTVPNTRINKKWNWNRIVGTLNNGTYNYKTHFDGAYSYRSTCTAISFKFPCWRRTSITADSVSARLKR